MTWDLAKQIDELRQALLGLKATGIGGFEGLLATVLTGITGIPFRLAASGFQHGVDGKAAHQDDGIAFEAKRYDKPQQLTRSDVLSKLAEVGMNDTGTTELWILGATIPVSTQIQDSARQRAAKDGLSVLILDWCENDLPILGVALSMAESASLGHLEKNLPPEIVANAASALQAVKKCDRFQSYADKLRSELEEPTMGPGTARQKNAEWLTDVFSNKNKAITTLGQALSPEDSSSFTTIRRQALTDQIKPYFTKQPDNTLLAVVGGEGNGKSWLVAQSWLLLDKRPLMLVLTPEDVARTVGSDPLEELLIPKLIEQRNNSKTELANERWRKTLRRWQDIDVDSPRIVVFVDGLNQRPRLSWKQVLDRLATDVARIGGRLIVSSRTAYFDLLYERLLNPVEKVNVPEWTETERDEILAMYNIQGSELNESVARSLRNPRILGIALALVETGDIEDFEEISISRLLFEHLRRHAPGPESPLSPDEFAEKLKDHGKEIIGRAAADQEEDLNIFEGELAAVADGRFFIPVENDPWRYTLEDRGLTLALGLAVIEKIVAADRNKKDMDATLDEMLEPVSALDEMGKVVLAALTSACVDTRYSPRVGAVLVRAFARLQNPEDEDLEPFGSLARRRPEAFVEGAEKLWLSDTHEPNRDWVEYALIKATYNDDSWLVIAKWISKWFGYYSLSPYHNMHAHPSRDPVEKVQEERVKRQAKIDENLEGLCPAEKVFLNTLEEKGSDDIAMLWHLPIKLLAGKTLAPFANSFVKWCFGHAVNPPFAAPYREFLNLVRFNRMDWAETRATIIAQSKWLHEADISKTGRWALVGLLQATGAAEDAEREDELVTELTKDRGRKGWWLNEDYCSSDPCDPKSQKPANIEQTAGKYKTVDVSKLRRHLSLTGEDHFFINARPGVARFKPEIAVAKHKELIDDIIGRTGFPLRQGLFELRDDNALLSREQAIRLLDVGMEMASSSGDEIVSESDRFTVALYSKISAFPLLDAEEQIQAVLSDSQNTSRYLDLQDVAKPIDSHTFDELLERTFRDNDEDAQRRILAFGPCRKGTVTKRLRAFCRSLMSSSSEDVRANTLRLIHVLGDEELLRFVVDDGWSAQYLEKVDSHEAWRGSLVIMQAVEQGIITEPEAFLRIIPQVYGRASRRFGVETVQNIAIRIDASIEHAANVTISQPEPFIDLTLQTENDEEPNRYQISDRPSDMKEPFQSLKEFPESAQAFEERQERLRKAFEAIKAELDDSNRSFQAVLPLMARR